MRIFLTLLLAYGIGSFSSAYFIGRVFKNIDIRKYGSGNAGATNAIRVMGNKLGIVTFLLDVLKGIIVVLVSRAILGDMGGYIGGFAAVIGHNWPIFIGFKGGKGVATSLGVIFILHWPTAIICLLLGMVIFLITRYVSLGSILFLSSTPIVNAIITKEFNKMFFITTLFLALLAIYRHKANFQRLFNGTENKFGR
ncbi:MAG: glycerol-3-phosphate 1-O-acyltransferase PlsY [Tissierellia bacterium]|nr:glycerol-3-phosphate 1-O-acyltransferase PlsY [Tissierellia bacterium]